MGLDSRMFEPAIVLKNNTPVDDFCGLTPTEMHRLLHNPLSVESPLALRSEITGQTLDDVPFFRLAEELLQMIEKVNSMDLTSTGALKRNVIMELYSKRILPEWEIEEGIMKLSRENDSTVIRSLRHILEFSRVVRRVHDKLKLTKEGNRLTRDDNRIELFRSLLSTFTLGFAWSSNDRYTELPAGQYGWAYSIYLLMTFGNEPRPVQFYADKYLQASPMSFAGSPTAPTAHLRRISHHATECVCFRDSLSGLALLIEWYRMPGLNPHRGRSLAGISY